MRFISTVLIICTIFLSTLSEAAIKTKKIEYRSDGITLEGFLAAPLDQKKKLRPAILIVHDWMGPSAFTRKKAEQLADEGYIAMAVDIYGRDLRPKNEEQAKEASSKFFNDRALFRKRIRAAYDALIKMDAVNAKKVVVMGYCFGGTGALELARSSVPLAGTVSFHGILTNSNPEDSTPIKGPVLILQGQEDPFVTPDQVQAFKDEMNKRHAEYEVIEYPDAVHAFTNPNAGNDKSKGTAYNSKADRESWQEFEKFLSKVMQ